MQLNDKVQHVYLVGAKSLGAYGGYETFVYKLTEYHQNPAKSTASSSRTYPDLVVITWTTGIKLAAM